MGYMVEGEWTQNDYFTDEKGHYKREETDFRDWIRADGSTPYEVESGRYHLYVSLGCPWAHRTLIVRAMKGLEDAVSVSIVHPILSGDGWSFDEAPGTIPDTVNDTDLLREVYTMADPNYTGRVTVPVLWDRREETIVNNESIEIVRMFDIEFDEVANAPDVDLYPEGYRDQIDQTVDEIYGPINNGVYRAGFAGTQEAYEEAVDALFDALDRWDAHLEDHRYLCGDRVTEADICMFTTLYRFDPVYHTHFKCTRQRLVEYANLWDYARELYQIPEVRETCDMWHIQQCYYRSHPQLNPKGIVAVEPRMDWEKPHGRDHLEGAPP